MIVSAPYRSGGTTLCNKLAKEHNLIFAGQIDNNTVEFTKLEDKNLIHEYQNQPQHTITDIVKMLADDSKVVILNNSSTALFNRSTHFIVRDDFSRVYSSIYWMMAKIYPKMGPMLVESMFKRITFYNAALLAHLKMTGTVPLLLEKQDWYVPTTEHVIPQEISQMISPHIEYLKEFK